MRENGQKKVGVDGRLRQTRARVLNRKPSPWPTYNLGFNGTRMPNVPLDSQVGGHPGILSDASGDLVIKPLLPVEHAFYSLLEAEDHHLAPLIGLTPRFMGVLELQGQLEEGEEKELDQTDVGRLLQGKEVDGVKPVESSAQEPKKVRLPSPSPSFSSYPD